MKKITSKEIFIKIIMLSVIILVAVSGILGCRTNRDIIRVGLNAAEQQTGSGSSGQTESEADKTSAVNENNSSGKSEINNQANSGSETLIGTESSSQASTGDDTAVAPGNHDVANSMSGKYFLEWIQKPAFNNAGSPGIKAQCRPARQ